MKKLFLIAALCMFVFSANTFAQEKSYVYCELVGTGKMMSTKLTVQADFGQKTSVWKGVSSVKDADGKTMKFNSMVDAMNYFGQQGWEFVQAYVVSGSNQNVYRWLLKKEVTAEELNKVVEAPED